MTSTSGICVALVALVSACLPGTPAPAAASGLIGPPTPIPLSRAYDINARGVVVGTPIPGQCFHCDVATWDGRRVRELDVPLGAGGNTWYPSQIDARGEIAGFVQDDVGGSTAFVWTDGRVDYLPRPQPSMGSVAVALNDSGLVAGYAAFVWLESPHLAAIWRDGVAVDLSSCCPHESEAVAVNAAGSVVINGFDSFNASVPRAVYRWRDGRTDRVEGLSSATAINASGTIAGAVDEPAGNPTSQAAIWRHGHVTVLDELPGATASSAADINVYGDVVGSSYTSPIIGAGAASGFFWNRRTGMVLLPSLPDRSCEALGINARRQILGDCLGPDMYEHQPVVWNASNAVS